MFLILFSLLTMVMTYQKEREMLVALMMKWDKR